MVEHAVQQHPHAPRVRLAAQGAEVLRRPQHGVDGHVVGGVVAVVGGCLKNGIEVQGGHAQTFQIVQLGNDPCQIAAEKVAVADLSPLVGAKLRRVLPIFMHRPVAHQSGGVGNAAAAEPIRKDLVAHAAAEPVRRGAVFFVYRQLPLRQRHGLAAAPPQGKAVPRQLRPTGGGIHAPPCAAAQSQRNGLLSAGKFLRDVQRAADNVFFLGAEHGKRHFGAAGNGTEGGFTSGVAGIKIG